MSTRVLPKHGLQPKKGQSKCFACHKEFGFMRTEFTCKRCYRSVCDKCSPDTQPTFSSAGEKSIRRVCLGCSKEHKLSLSMIETSKVEFRTDSQLAAEWLMKLNKQGLTFVGVKQLYILHLTSSNPSPEALRYRPLRQKVVTELLQGLNYSLRSFLLLSMSSFDRQEVERALSNCLTALLNKVRGLVFSPYLAFMVLFFLMLASEVTAFFILSQLYQKLLLTEHERISSRVLEFISLYDRTLPKDIQAKYGKTTQVLAKALTANVVKMEVTLFVVQQIVESEQPQQQMLLSLSAVSYLVIKALVGKEADKFNQVVYTTTMAKLRSCMQQMRPKGSLLAKLSESKESKEEEQLNYSSANSSEVGSPLTRSLSIASNPSKEEREEQTAADSLASEGERLQVKRLEKHAEKMSQQQARQIKKLKDKIHSLQKSSLTVKTEFEGKVQALREEAARLKKQNEALQRGGGGRPAAKEQVEGSSAGQFLEMISYLNKENREYLAQTESLKQRIRELESEREERRRQQQHERRAERRQLAELELRSEELEFELQQERKLLVSQEGRGNDLQEMGVIEEESSGSEGPADQFDAL